MPPASPPSSPIVRASELDAIEPWLAPAEAPFVHGYLSEGGFASLGERTLAALTDQHLVLVSWRILGRCRVVRVRREAIETVEARTCSNAGLYVGASLFCVLTLGLGLFLLVPFVWAWVRLFPRGLRVWMRGGTQVRVQTDPNGSACLEQLLAEILGGPASGAVQAFETAPLPGAEGTGVRPAHPRSQTWYDGAQSSGSVTIPVPAARVSQSANAPSVIPPPRLPAPPAPHASGPGTPSPIVAPVPISPTQGLSPALSPSPPAPPAVQTDAEWWKS